MEAPLPAACGHTWHPACARNVPGTAWGVPPWAPGSSLLPNGAAGSGLVSGPSSAVLPLAVLPVPGWQVPWAVQNCHLSVPQFGFAGSNGSLCFILLIPPGAPRCGEVARSSFGVVTVLCAAPCSVPPGDAPMGSRHSPAPAAGAISCSFGKVSGPEWRIRYIIHAAASPGGWVTAGAQPAAPRCPAHGVPREAGGSSRRAEPGLPYPRPSAMPSRGPPAAKGATHGHVPRRNWAQVNTHPGQAVGSGAGRCAGSRLVPVQGIISQGSTGARA